MAASLWIGLGAKGWAVPGLGQLPGHGTIATGSATYQNVTQNGFTNAATLTVSGNTAILWGSSGGTLNVTGSGSGFNVGSSAYLSITAASNGSSLLNVDTTGSPSYIMGTINVTSAIPLFVANGSGVVVGPNAIITAPGGLGLLGYDLSGQASSFNGTVSVTPTTVGSFVNVQSGATLNASGASLLIAAPTVNVGIATSTSLVGTYGPNPISILAGYYFNQYYPSRGRYAEYGAPTPITNAIAGATPGSITISGPTSGFYAFPSGNPTGTLLLSSGNIITSGNLSLSGVGRLEWGTFNPSNLAAATFTNNGTIVWTAPGITHQLTTGSLVNNGTIQAGTSDVIINVGGSITNNSGATIDGGGFNVALLAGISSSPGNGIGGGIVNFGTINGYNYVRLVASNENGIGPYPGGGIFSNGTISITNPNGFSSTVINPVSFLFEEFGGPMVGTGTGSYLNVGSRTGNVFLGGTINVADPKGLGRAIFAAGYNPFTNAFTTASQQFTLATNITAQNVFFGGGSLVGPAVVTTQNMVIAARGNVNNRTGSDPLNNSFHLSNGPWAATTNVVINAIGTTGKQAINLAINGNATVNSGQTSTFLHNDTIGLSLPTPNAGSNLLVNASGNLTINPSMVIEYLAFDPYTLSKFVFHVPGFSFPGGIVFMSGGTLKINTIVDNGYTSQAVAGQGIFFQAPKIVTTSPVITSGNTWVNFSTTPTTVPAIYSATPVSKITPNIFNVALNPSAYHVRSFSP
ncbi:hypothetical protein IT6_06950 [Methylacidiphilum caldifontis]|uniref:beta strand repeat-containing protein n=1 Tax=Methylacidiphilum caldifontis TaxID=2795386 RepID=UPI001A8CE521|nr:hypothetical protein [Methylacidiphilum caldifontis]QSR88121.1 hypothetical protein IT6_06950 [Methylacidiphilum caldifontis]